MASVNVNEEYLRTIGKKEKILSSILHSVYSLLYLLAFLAIFLGHLLFITVLPFYIALGIITSAVGTAFVFTQDRQLRYLSGKWDFKRFREFQKIIRTFTVCVFAFECIIAVYSFSVDVATLPNWFVGLTFLLLSIWWLLFNLNRVFTIRAEASLFLQQFRGDFENSPQETDFKMALLASKKISKWLKTLNMQISPSSLAFGMSIAILENHGEEKIRSVIEGLDNPFDTTCFINFRRSIQDFITMAQESEIRGMKALAPMSFERLTQILAVIVVPISAAIITVVLPKLMEFFA